jgi:UDP-N-acetylglucosamine 2-epimerase (non-hydrolysing)
LRLRVLLVVGARPNFMKIAPIVRELERDPTTFDWRLVHTGQHYDAAMSEVFFEQLGIPRPHVDLGVGSGSHAQQTAAIIAAFEPIVLDWKPDLLVVVGDVNSTIACALVAAKLDVRIAHVEAGLRSFDREMPEEINRILTDRISDLLFVTEQSGIDNLTAEGVDPATIHFVGNVMIDTLLTHAATARQRNVPARFGLTPRHYGVLTLHRPSNVDHDATFARLLEALDVISRDLPLVFPVHPRTRPVLERSTAAQIVIGDGRLRLLEPLGYLDFLGLTANSAVVVTDSGDIQEETTVLGIPCLTLRESTERPVTTTEGTNRLVGTDPERILAGWRDILAGERQASIPLFWDGLAATRIVEVLRAEANATARAADGTAGAHG